jgi:hypothetical protein
MITFFYYFLLVFIWTKIFLVLNKQRLDLNFRSKDIMSIKKIDLVYYFTEFLFFVWMIIGLWSSQSVLFMTLLSLHLLKFPFYHLSKRLYAVWDNILPSISIIFIMIIFIYSLIH